MIYFSIVLFAVTAVLGLVILTRWLTKKDAPRSVIYSHGIFAVAAIAGIAYYGIVDQHNIPMAGIILLTLSVLGGFYMFIRDMRGKESPLAIAFVHALLAIAAVVVLLFAIFMS